MSKRYDPQDVMQSFNDVFDIIADEFGEHLLTRLGLVLIVFDFHEKNVFMNYKGARIKEEVHRLIREYLDRN